MKKERINKRKGFTLAELVIVVAIVAVLAGIAVAAFSKMTKASEDATFRANHRTLVSAVTMAYASNNGAKPDETDFQKIIEEAIVDPQNSATVGVAALKDKPMGAVYKVDFKTGIVTSTWTPKDGSAAITLTYKP